MLFSPDGKAAAITSGILTQGPTQESGVLYLQSCHVVNMDTAQCVVALTPTELGDDMNVIWAANSQTLGCSISITGVRALYLWDRNGALIKKVPYTGVKQ